MIENCYINFLNVKTDEKWSPETNPFTGPIVSRYRNIKHNCLNHLRTLRKTQYVYLQNGGWHFNALGGIQKKILDFKHPVYTIDYMKGREKGARIDENDLPEYLVENRNLYKHLFDESNTKQRIIALCLVAPIVVGVLLKLIAF